MAPEKHATKNLKRLFNFVSTKIWQEYICRFVYSATLVMSFTINLGQRLSETQGSFIHGKSRSNLKAVLLQ